LRISASYCAPVTDMLPGSRHTWCLTAIQDARDLLIRAIILIWRAGVGQRY